MFSPIFYPVDHGDGVFRPLTTSLIVRGVLNRSGATLTAAAGSVVQFDFHRSQAETTSWDPAAGSIVSGAFVSASVWGNVCFAPTVTAAMRSLSCAVFAYAITDSTDNTRVDVQVIGRATLTKTGGSAAHLVGATWTGTAGADTLTATLATGSLTGAKILAIADNAATAATFTGQFNGFGFGSN